MIKNYHDEDWRDGSAVIMTCCSCSDLGLVTSTHLPELTPLIILVLRNLMFSSGLYGYLHTCTYTHNTYLCIHKNKINLWIGGKVGRIWEKLGEGKLITIYCMDKYFQFKK